MEGMVSHSASVDDESALGNATDFLLYSLVIVIVLVGLYVRERRLRSPNDLQGLKLSILTDRDESPVVETAFPELTKVDLNIVHDLVFSNDVSWFNLMPRQQMEIVAGNGRWSTKSEEDLGISLLRILVHNTIDYEVLTNTPNGWSKSLK